jgi:Ca-activated chloride channel homolog
MRRVTARRDTQSARSQSTRPQRIPEKNMPLKTCFVAGLVLAATLVPGAAIAQETPAAGKTILVLDASGSMWGQIEGEAKISIARRVIDELLDNVPPEQSLGLSAYGHREKGNCADIELLVEPGTDTRDAIRAAVEGLNPKGKTPLSDAVIAAAEALKFEEEAATVILVSDGRETCDRDPCEVGRRLAELGIDFTAHVVGFDVSDPEDQAQLQCLAENTGGRFLTASNAGELSEALAEVSAPEAEKVDVLFEATEGEDGAVITRDLVWTLTNADTGEAVVEGFDIAALRMALEPGRYTAEVMRGSDEESAQRTVTVEDAGDQAFTLVLVTQLPDATVSTVSSADAGSTITVEWTGPDEERDHIAVAEPDARPGTTVNYTYTREGSPLKLMMPPQAGEYEIRYIRRQDNEILATQAITVEPVEATVSGPASAAAGETVLVEWTGPDYDRDYIAVAEAGSESRQQVNYTYTREGSPLKLVMPPEPGEYEIRYIQRQGREILARQPVTVEAVGASVSGPATAAAGETVLVEWTGPDYDRDYIAVAEAGSESRHQINYTYTREGSPLKLVMPPEPGEYEIRYIQRQGREILASQPVTVEAVGASVSGPATADAGETVLLEWTGPDYDRDYIAVAEVGSESRHQINYTYTREGSPLKLVMPPEPGEYEIRYIQRQGREILASQPITVESVEASVSIPATAAAGEDLLVEWTGPDYHRDYIAVAEVGADAREHINFTYTRNGSPLKLKLPSEPGEYEVRYIQRQGRKVLAGEPLTVE